MQVIVYVDLPVYCNKVLQTIWHQLSLKMTAKQDNLKTHEVTITVKTGRKLMSIIFLLS